MCLYMYLYVACNRLLLTKDCVLHEIPSTYHTVGAAFVCHCISSTKKMEVLQEYKLCPNNC
uniref:Uncharacterized protein n=1 Tax=Amphimedon queenslandica TaxID=400682 RepID=A0A1X7T5D7_AMPQE